jgi:hypothetical protein
MQVRFFNFHNTATYHTFQWLIRSADVSLPSLIDEAYTKAKADPDGQASVVAIDLAAAARDELERILGDAVEEAVSEWLGVSLEECELVDESLSKEQDLGPEELCRPFVAMFFNEICFRTLAEAVMLWHDNK